MTAFWNQNTAAAGAAAVAGLAGMAASGGLSGDAMMDYLTKSGSAAWKSGSAGMIPGFESGMMVLRPYFSVDNRYVLRKIKKVLFPFLGLQWRRLVSSYPVNLLILYT